MLGEIEENTNFHYYDTNIISEEATIDTDDVGYKWLLDWRIVLLVLNCVIGLSLFEFAWYYTSKFRDPIPELNDLMPHYRRDDATKWRKW